MRRSAAISVRMGNDARRRCENMRKNNVPTNPSQGTQCPGDGGGDSDSREEDESGNSAEVADRVRAVVEGEFSGPEGELDVVRNRPTLAVQIFVPMKAEVESDGIESRAAADGEREWYQREEQRGVEQRAVVRRTPCVLP